ncbi:hypothetical protein GCM10027347_38400 [Larkinella harenae]
MISCLNDPDPEAEVFVTAVPEVYRKIYGASSVTRSGNYVVIKTKGLPDHKSPYFQHTKWATAQYEAYNGTNPAWKQSSNEIDSVSYTFQLPIDPKAASPKATLKGGEPSGIALNGVPFFSQHEAGESGLDQYNGHPTTTGDYHYHLEPTFLTTNKGKEALVGFMLDGFPVYGPVENGKPVASSSLDAYHGHRHPTADYPQGIYHYHITASSSSGTALYGTLGTYTK